MVKVISFSLWGDDPKYSLGMVENAKLAAELFPDWECWVYCTRHGGFGPGVAFDELDRMDNVKIIALHMSNNGFAKADWTGMFWRFDAINDPDVDVMISRDCDSRLSPREKAAVDEWLESDKGFHIMRDHYHHSVPILGGMFGMKRDCLPAFSALLGNWKQEDRWQTDQEFLAQEIWPRVRHDSLIHSSFHAEFLGGKPFPTPLNDKYEFVGATYDENNVIDAGQVEELKKYVK
jgi:hypothetical protein